MNNTTGLTKEWSKFDPEEGYSKEMQDVKLKNGDILTMCWPNAGVWNLCTAEGNDPKYIGRAIDVEQTEWVRLTHSKEW